MTSPRRPRRTATAAGVLVATLSLLACAEDGSEAQRPADTEVRSDRCVVRLHGRSGTGADPVDHGTWAELSPTGNEPAEGGRQWIYAPDDRYREALSEVTAWTDAVGCEEVVLYGFSNGAAFAAALHCQGEDLDGRLVGVVIDDPVTDEAVEDCQPADGVEAALYWTGALTEAQPGVRCTDIGYTCSGEIVLGIEAYAEHLGIEAQASPNNDHIWYPDAPEIARWLGIGG